MSLQFSTIKNESIYWDTKWPFIYGGQTVFSEEVTLELWITGKIQASKEGGKDHFQEREWLVQR